MASNFLFSKWRTDNYLDYNVRKERVKDFRLKEK